MSTPSVPGDKVDDIGDAPKLFLRKATGLRRELGVWDAFNMDWSTAAPFANVAVLVPLGLALFAGANIPLSIASGIIVSMSIVMVYALLARAIPRSGGDYVFNSRILHPAVGFITSWTMLLLLTFFSGFSAYSLGAWLLPDLFGPLGVMIHNQGLVNFAVTVSSPGWIVGIAIVELAVLAGVMIAGVRVAARVIWSSTIFMALAFVVTAIVLLTTSHGSYLHNFNTFAAHFGTSAAKVEAAAAKGGAILHPTFNLGSTIAFWPLILGITGYSVTSVFVGGEVRNAKQNQLIALIGAGLATLIVMVVIVVLEFRVVPQALVNALGYFDLINPAKSPFPFPLFGHLPIALGSTNPLLLILLFLAVGSGLWVATLANFFWMTRYILAWSMDRMAPPLLAEVRGKNRAMVNATVAVAAIGVVFAVLLEYVPTFTVIAGYFPQVLLLGATCVAGIVFPWKMKALYSASGQPRLAGVPLVAIFGVIGLAFLGLAVYYYFTNAIFGAITMASLWFFIALVVSGCLCYGVARFVGKQQGYNLARAQSEIPPE